jgi:hypothetical protein
LSGWLPPVRAARCSTDRVVTQIRQDAIRSGIRARVSNHHRPVSLRELRTSHLTLEHAELVAQEHDLDLLLPLRAKAQHHQLEQPAQRPVHKRQNDALRAARHER